MYIDLVTINLCPGQGGGGVKPSGTLDIVENGVYNVYTYASASVDVHPSISLSETYISNGSYNITGEFNGGVITVDVPAPQFVTETLNVSANGTYTPGQGVDGYSKVVVDVPQSVTGFTEKEVTEGVQIVNLSNSASYVHPNVFEKDNYLQTVYLPNCISVGEGAFAYCNNLTTVNLPVCTIISSNGFNGCANLKTINIPLCSEIGGSAFLMWSDFVSELNLPKCINIGNNAFGRCYSLATVNLPVCRNINHYAFSGCSSLNSLTLCTDVYWTIPYGNFLPGTPIMSGTGSIYVRSDTYSAWITSNGWSSLSDRFVSIETSGFALSFSEGTVYGTTKGLYNDFLSYLGISKSDITKVILPECNYIESSIFINYSALSQISFPRCEYIGDSTFYGCTSLNSINLPICSYIGSDAFYSCSLLSQVSLPMCSYIGASAFHRCYSLSQVNLPVCSYIENNAFYNCKLLNQVNFPVCSYIGNSVFFNCYSLSQASLPLCEYIGSGAFRTCSLLSLSLPVCSYIGGLAFYGCSSLSIITIGYSGICSLGDARTFETTQITSSTGSIYVPASLVDSYKSANYWSYFSTQIFPISE